jgi:hypothetical protein
MIASMAVKKKLGRWMDAAGKVNLSLSFACVQAGEIQMWWFEQSAGFGISAAFEHRKSASTGVGVVLVEGSLNQKKGFDFELIRMLSKDVTPCWLSQIPAGIKRVVLQIETSWDTLAPRNKCESFDFTAAAVTAWNLVMPHFCDDGGALSFTSNEMGQLFYMLAARKLAESVGSSE